LLSTKVNRDQQPDDESRSNKNAVGREKEMSELEKTGIQDAEGLLIASLNGIAAGC